MWNLLLVWLLLSPISLSAQTREDALRIEASASTAGPYGELWQLKLAPDGSAEVEIGYMLNPMGAMKGHFTASKERVAAVRASVSEARFFALPKSISPKIVGMHRPDLRLQVTLGDRQHTVNLYDPDELKGDERARRFLIAWKAAFAHVPLRPAW
jgi:hypothetical protein